MLDWTIQDFSDRLASAEPTPGGGSVAALTGALAAGLAAMVCSLTVGKPRYAAVEDELRAALAAAQDLRRQLEVLVIADVAAYDGLSAAYQRSKDDPARAEAIQAALVAATDAPLAIAEAAAAVIDLVPAIAAKGSRLAVSDAGMAALLAVAALRSAALNVRINVAATADPARAAAALARLEAAMAGREAVAEEVYQAVTAAIGGAA